MHDSFIQEEHGVAFKDELLDKLTKVLEKPEGLTADIGLSRIGNQ